MTLLVVLFVTFSGVLGDLHLGDQRVTWKKLDYDFFFAFSLKVLSSLGLKLRGSGEKNMIFLGICITGVNQIEHNDLNRLGDSLSYSCLETLPFFSSKILLRHF